MSTVSCSTYLIVAVGLAELVDDGVLKVWVVERQRGRQPECTLHQRAAFLHAHDVQIHPAQRSRGKVRDKMMVVLG